FQAEDGIRDKLVTGVQTCALPISSVPWERVFVYRDTDMCRAQFHDTLGHTFQNYQAQIRLTVKVRFLVGVARRLAETIGTAAIRSEERRVGKEGRRRREQRTDSTK